MLKNYGPIGIVFCISMSYADDFAMASFVQLGGT